MRRKGLKKITAWFTVLCILMAIVMPVSAWAEENTEDMPEDTVNELNSDEQVEKDKSDPEPQNGETTSEDAVQPEGFSILSSPEEGDAYVYSGWAGNPDQSVTFPDGTVIDKTQPGTYLTIESGITGVQAGRTLFIADGDYTGSGMTIDKNISIIGQSRTGTVIDAGRANRIFTISALRNVTISNLTMSNGRISTASGFDFYFGGGAIFNKGTLTVNNCAFTGNTAQGNDIFVGGAVYNYENSALTINHCAFSDNFAQEYGGAIYSDWYATLDIDGSTFTGNTALFGGAVCSSRGVLTVEDSSFTNNSATGDFYGGGGGAISSSEDEVLVKGCTFTYNTAAADGGAICFGSAAIVEDSIFANNSAGSGGAVHNGEYAELTVTGSTFTTNAAIDYGGAISNYGELTLDESILEQNSAAGYGGALYTGFDDCNISNSTFEGNRVTSTWSGDGKGGAVFSFDCVLRIDTCDFIDNLADNSGGAVYNDEPWFNESSTLEAVNCNFTGNSTNTGANRNGGAIYNCDILILEACNLSNNTAGTNGGAVYNDSGNAEIHFNRITDNTPGDSQIRRSGGTVNIAGNWWGDNAGPAGKIAGAGMTPAIWLVLTASRDREVLDVGEVSTLTADLLHDNQGNYHASSNGHIPDGISISFGESGNPPLGSFSPLSGTMVDGQASTGFTAGRPGTANIIVSVDNQQVSTQIDINRIPTGLTAGNADGINGQTVNISSILTDSTDQVLTGKAIVFSIGGAETGHSLTDDNGIAVLSYTITENEGSYPITVRFEGDTEYLESTDSGTLTVNAAPDSGGGDNKGGGKPVRPPAPVPIIDSNGNITAVPKLDNNTGVAAANIDTATLNTAFEKAAKNSDGKQTIKITINAEKGALAYESTLPASALTSSGTDTRLEIKTDIASVTLPSNMLTAEAAEGVQNVSLTVARADVSSLDAEARSLVGNRPVIQLSLLVDGAPYAWSNANAPVSVSIPYTPTEAELANPESIVIWYIDGGGNLVSVPDGRYDPAAGMVTFITIHFSDYAVGYNKVSFSDVPAGAWFGKAVSFIAAREITTGTGGGNFSPDAKLTRGQFIVMLMKAYEIAPDAMGSGGPGSAAEAADNFSDAGSKYYTGYLAAAKRLGISGGVGNNMFAPERQITRQEMFALLYNALKAIGRLPQTTAPVSAGEPYRTLADFSDAGQVASWAEEAMTLLVETGTVSGSGGKLSPVGTATRVEMAQVLYNLISR